ncbi:hypothetical protein M8J76_013807 [Diaphorina citri]|nr:hypothetical protein M8J76_013807 [Diaphorina citri]
MVMSGLYWKWPERKDSCWYKKIDVLEKIDVPIIVNASSQPPLLSLCARRECVTIDEVSLPPSPLPPQFPASCIELVRSARVLTRYLYLRPRCHLSSQPPLLSLCARRECVTIDEVSLPPSPLPPQFPASSTELVRSARVLTSSQPPLLSLCARRECVTIDEVSLAPFPAATSVPSLLY